MGRRFLRVGCNLKKGKTGLLAWFRPREREREREGEKKNLYSILFLLGKGEPFFKTNPNPTPKPISSIRSEAFNVMMKNPKEQEGEIKKENNYAAAMIRNQIVEKEKKYIKKVPLFSPPFPPPPSRKKFFPPLSRLQPRLLWEI